MASLFDVLDNPIDWRNSALWPMLGDLQGNILQGHGRDHSQHIFLRFDPARAVSVRQALRGVAAHLTSALTQLREDQNARAFGRPGGTRFSFAMSAAGYRALGMTPPGDPAFGAGMGARSETLGDPDPEDWEDHLRGIHAMIVVADDSETIVAEAAARLSAGFEAAGITITGCDDGHALRPPVTEDKGPGLDHFGYLDSSSQPRLLAQDVDPDRAGWPYLVWHSGFSPRECALVPDPHGGFEESYGSYLIYRKLEQDVAGFRAREDALADALCLIGDDREPGRAQATDHAAGGDTLVLDPQAGATCCSLQPDGEPCGKDVFRPRPEPVDARRHAMPHHGIAYDERIDIAELAGHFPSCGVGLLFMACNADIGRQFEYFQAVRSGGPASTDGTTFRAAASDTSRSAPPWHGLFGAHKEQSVHVDLDGLVTLKGGEYLFAPAISTLGGL